MEWRRDYETGLAEIDNQHKELLDLFARITAAINADNGWSELHYKIVDLRTFANFHFEFEEALMRLYGYQEHENHAESHKQFFVRLNEVERSSIQGDVKTELVRFLCDWLFGHIMTADKAYASHILAGAAVVRT